MNSNETSILPHTIALHLVARADQVAAAVLEEKGEVYSPASVLLDVISVVCDNAFEVEVRITKDGYQFIIPQSETADDALDAMHRGFDVIEESALEG